MLFLSLQRLVSQRNTHLHFYLLLHCRTSWCTTRTSRPTLSLTGTAARRRSASAPTGKSTAYRTTRTAALRAMTTLLGRTAAHSISTWDGCLHSDFQQ